MVFLWCSYGYPTRPSAMATEHRSGRRPQRWPPAAVGSSAARRCPAERHAAKQCRRGGHESQPGSSVLGGAGESIMCILYIIYIYIYISIYIVYIYIHMNINDM